MSIRSERVYQSWRAIGSEASELSASQATFAPEAALKIAAIAPSGNALSAAADGAVL